MLERLAREDLGMVHPRDVVIELPEEAGVAPGPRPPVQPPAPSPAPSPPPSPGAGETLHAVTPEAGLVGPPAPSPAAVPVSGPPGRE
jgi:hypothetical protein